MIPLEKKLSDAVAVHAPRLEAELIQGYKDHARHVTQLITDLTRQHTQGKVYLSSSSFDPTSRRFESLCKEGLTTPRASIYGISELKVVPDYKPDFAAAEKRGHAAFVEARDLFISKTTGKILDVLGKRDDVAEVDIRVTVSRGLLSGVIGVRLRDHSEFVAAVEMKYVLRTVPNLTPYWQYPLVFTQALIKGTVVNRPSELELYQALGNTGRSLPSETKLEQNREEKRNDKQKKKLIEELLKQIDRADKTYDIRELLKSIEFFTKLLKKVDKGTWQPDFVQAQLIDFHGHTREQVIQQMRDNLAKDLAQLPAAAAQLGFTPENAAAGVAARRKQLAELRERVKSGELTSLEGLL